MSEPCPSLHCNALHTLYMHESARALTQDVTLHHCDITWRLRACKRRCRRRIRRGQRCSDALHQVLIQGLPGAPDSRSPARLCPLHEISVASIPGRPNPFRRVVGYHLPDWHAPDALQLQRPTAQALTFQGCLRLPGRVM